MQVKLNYSSAQVETAIDFISKNNQNFLGEVDHIRKTLWENITEIVEKFPHLRMISTMGFTLIAESSEESIDEDENEIYLDISVDPALGKDYESESQIFDVKRKGEISQAG